MEAATGLLETPPLGQTAWLWLSFFVIVAGLRAFDLGVLHKGDRAIEVRESVLLSASYTAAGLMFGIWIWWQLGAQSATEYVTGYLIESRCRSTMCSCRRMVLLHGFIKKTQQTPSEDIELAQKRFKEWQRGET